MGFFYNFHGCFGEQKKPCSDIEYRFINSDEPFSCIEAGTLNFLAHVVTYLIIDSLFLVEYNLNELQAFLLLADFLSNRVHYSKSWKQMLLDRQMK